MGTSRKRGAPSVSESVSVADDAFQEVDSDSESGAVVVDEEWAAIELHDLDEP
jgi:hypothetical protein